MEEEDATVVKVESVPLVKVDDEAVTKTGDNVIKAEYKVIMLQAGDNTMVKMGDKETIKVAQKMEIDGYGTQKSIIALCLIYQPLPGVKGEAACVRGQLKCFQLFLSSKVYNEILMQSYSICMQINKE